MRTYNLRSVVALGFLICCVVNGPAAVRLPRVFSSHMVLQQEKPIQVWGWANPNERVTVQIGSATESATANEGGEWRVVLPALKAGGPLVLSVTGSNAIQLDDVLVGEVWLCSGQSNMEMGIAQVDNGREEIAAATDSGIRLLMVPNHWAQEPQSDIQDAAWKRCSPETIAQGGWGGFSATAYFFGRELRKQLGVPVGLIDSDWGGTRIESWTPPEGFAGVPALQKESEKVELGNPRTAAHQARLSAVLKETEAWLGQAREALNKQTLVPTMPTYPPELLPPQTLQSATALYNGMIHPIQPFALRGAIWYQGESNLEDGVLYTERMNALIGGWRKVWAQGDFPFYFVQIAPFNYGGRADRMGVFWEAQTAAQAVPNTGMAVINDIGDLKDIHPRNKQGVGQRLAFWALAKTYGKENIVYSGPVFKSFNPEGNKLRVTFDHSSGGLKSRDGKPLNWFEIIDAEKGGFVQANAEIQGSDVIVAAPGVNQPVAVRFAWSMLAEPNLANGAGLPAGAFRAGTVPSRDVLALEVPEAKQYQLVYDLDLNQAGPKIDYTVNNAGKITQPFGRIAFCLELQRDGGDSQFVYVSIDAFTDDLKKIAIPTTDSGANFQQKLAHMNVYSNVKQISVGTNLDGGNIEFWPNNYGPANSAKVPNASGDVYDFGDQPAEPKQGYGSMQIHNHKAGQTIFAVNHWTEKGKADIGIGNQPQGNPDWTFAGNAGAYSAKRLRVLVQPK